MISQTAMIIITILGSIVSGLVVGVGSFFVGRSTTNRQLEEHKKRHKEERELERATDASTHNEIVTVLKEMSKNLIKVEKDVVVVKTTIRSYDDLWKRLEKTEDVFKEFMTELGLVRERVASLEELTKK